MDENLQDTEELFYSNLEGQAEEPPVYAWDHISQTLDRDNLILIKKKYNRVKRLAAFLLLLLIGFSVYEINSGRGDKRGSNGETVQASTIPAANGEKNTRNAGGARNETSEKTLQPYKAGGSFGNEQQLQGNNPPGDISIVGDASALLINRTNNISSKTGATIHNVGAESDIYAAKENNLPGNNKIENISATLENPVLQNRPAVSAPTTTFADILRSAKPDSAQNKTAAYKLKKKNKKAHEFSITPYFSPDIAWYRLQDDKPDNNIDDAHELEKSEQHEFSSTFGVTAEYSLNNRWSLQSGLSYSNTNITLEPKELYAVADVDGTIKYRMNTSSGDAYLLPSFNVHPVAGDSLYSSSSLHSLKYVGIPVAIVRRFSAGRFTIKTIAGISANILMHAKVETIVSKGLQKSAETIDQVRGLKKMYIGGLAGLGLEYRVGLRTSMSLMPSLRFAVSSINKENAVRSYPISFGFNTGLKISF